VLRAGLLAEAARRLDGALSVRVFKAQHARSLHAHSSRAYGEAGLEPLRDLEQVRALVASGALAALFDLPFLPLYLGVIFLIHPALGALALGGAAMLLALMLSSERRNPDAARAAAAVATQRLSFAADAHRNAEAIQAMGFLAPAAERWLRLSTALIDEQRRAGRRTAYVAAAIRAARPALQSATLGLGAYLAMTHRTSAGSMLAASILLARGLAPLEALIAHWRNLLAARDSGFRLAGLLTPTRSDDRRTQCQSPARELTVEHLTAAPPRVQAPTLHDVSFSLAAGSGLAVLGPSGAGKSTLARALVGVWPAQAGCVRLDGVRLSEFEPDALGRHVGYLPQEACLFSGTIADNISRFDPAASEEAIIAAARAAGAERLIEALPARYQAHIGSGGVALSKGEHQRIALARALYKEPFLVVLDEPDAGLDAGGVRHLNAAIVAIRRRGGIVAVTAQRRSALAGLDQMLLLVAGRLAAFGRLEPMMANEDSPNPEWSIEAAPPRSAEVAG
jgi:ATP-binding cassette subfamily C protein